MLRYADHVRAHEIITGTTISGWYVTQAESLDSSQYIDELNQRMRLFGAEPDDRYIRLIDANPGSPSHFIYKRFIDASSYSFLGSQNIYRINIETTPDNSIYSQETLNEWKTSMSTTNYLRRVSGVWCAGQGQVYEDYDLHPTEVMPSQVSEFYIGFDPGTVGQSENELRNKVGNIGLVWVGLLEDKQWCVIDEQQPLFKGLDELTGLIESTNYYWGSDKFQGMIKDWHGGSGEVYQRYFQAHTSISPVFTPSYNKSKWFKVAAGVNMLRQAFKVKSLAVSPKCRLLLKDMGNYMIGDDGEPDKTRYDSHLLDALRYCWIRIGSRSEWQ